MGRGQSCLRFNVPPPKPLAEFRFFFGGFFGPLVVVAVLDAFGVDVGPAALLRVLVQDVVFGELGMGLADEAGVAREGARPGCSPGESESASSSSVGMGVARLRCARS